MGSSLYDDDLFAWSERQAAALRRLAARPDLTDEVDWDNVIEEIETLGRSDLRAVESNLEHFLAHVINMVSEPGNAPNHWRGEAFGFLSQARSIYAPSMRQRIDLNELWTTGMGLARAGFMDDGGPAVAEPARRMPVDTRRIAFARARCRQGACYHRSKTQQLTHELRG